MLLHLIGNLYTRIARVCVFVGVNVCLCLCTDKKGTEHITQFREISYQRLNTLLVHMFMNNPLFFENHHHHHHVHEGLGVFPVRLKIIVQLATKCYYVL
jgi:hypothetical protein